MTELHGSCLCSVAHLSATYPDGEVHEFDVASSVLFTGRIEVQLHLDDDVVPLVLFVVERALLQQRRRALGLLQRERQVLLVLQLKHQRVAVAVRKAGFNRA